VGELSDDEKLGLPEFVLQKFEDLGEFFTERPIKPTPRNLFPRETSIRRFNRMILFRDELYVNVQPVTVMGPEALGDGTIRNLILQYAQYIDWDDFFGCKVQSMSS
jgi:hypothetical protein